MRGVDAIQKLRRHKPELQKLGITSLYLFGSTARDQAAADSDVDLFFDYPKGRLGLYELIDIKQAAQRILGCPADIMTRSSLHPILRADIEASAVRVF